MTQFFKTRASPFLICCTTKGISFLFLLGCQSSARSCTLCRACDTKYRHYSLDVFQRVPLLAHCVFCGEVHASGIFQEFADSWENLLYFPTGYPSFFSSPDSESCPHSLLMTFHSFQWLCGGSSGGYSLVTRTTFCHIAYRILDFNKLAERLAKSARQTLHGTHRFKAETFEYSHHLPTLYFGIYTQRSVFD